MPREPERIPVLVGAGEIADRVTDPRDAREPIALMAEALRRAAEDAGAPGLLARLDSLEVAIVMIREVIERQMADVGHLDVAVASLEDDMREIRKGLRGAS
jgi:hypothetical protein